jgi:hypothetical protein
LLQSKKPAVQAPIPQAPVVQVATALSGTEQAVPQAPQLLRSLDRSWQLDPQQVSLVFRHGWVAEQPWAQAFFTQIWPAVQSVSPRHSTHLFVVVSHFVVGPLQSVPSAQPAAQPFWAVQYCPVGHLSF